MQRPLDPQNFKQNTYERPAQEWICGRTAGGHPCPLGPDQRGKCRATSECMPVRKRDRWSCTRGEAVGGKCEEGPRPDGSCCHPVPPCQPVRSLRRLRRIAVSLALAFTIGALFFFFGGKDRERWLDPGELSAFHGTLARQGTTAAKCGDCHSASDAKANGSPPFSHSRLADSQLCLKCHTGLGEHPLQAHAVDAPKLAALTRKAQSVASGTDAPLVLQISRKVSGINPHGGELACATCHREHQGRGARLTQLTDAQCQVCHAAQFTSFTQGHPQFTKYPYQRRTRIYFDHTKHLDEHFTGKKKDRALSCTGCHTTEASGRLMLVQEFQQTCAACHAGQIKGDGSPSQGLAFFSVPELDVDTLESKGHRIGEWPHTGQSGDKVTPFMELLLGTDASLRAAMEKLRGVNLNDLSNAGVDKLDAAEKLAWGVKSLLFDITTGGHDMLIERLETDRAAGQNRLSPKLTGHMSRAVLVAAQQEWMPHLLTEMPDYRKGIKPPPPKPPAPVPAAPPPPKPASPGGNEDLTDATSPPAMPKEMKPTGGDDLILDPGDLLSAPKSPAPPAKTPAPAGGRKVPAGDAGDLLSATADTPPPKAAGGENAGAAEIKPAEDWVAGGGWYRPEKSFTLFYRPAGHADSFLTAWLSTAAGMSAGPSADVARAAFRKLADPLAPGLCMKCHTVDASGGAPQVNWLPAHPEPQIHPFTVFKHKTHLSLLTDQGCQTCHQRDPKSEYAKFFTSTDGTLPDDPGRFAGNFVPLTKAVCAECHKPQIAGDNCLLCHRYHTGAITPKMNDAAGFHTAPDRKSDVGLGTVTGERGKEQPVRIIRSTPVR